MSCDSVPLFLSTPLLLSVKHRAKKQTAQTVGHIILALVRSQAELGEWCYCDVYGLYQKSGQEAHLTFNTSP